MMGVLNHLSTLLLLSLLPPALSHVVENFSVVPRCKEFFLEGTTPNLPGILYDGIVQDQNRYKPICQLFKNMYRFATLYDTTNRIPVFSAYTFTGDGGKRPYQRWMIEPQLEDEMNVDNKNVKHQAANTDYLNNGLGLTRGHLFPCSYAPNDAAKRSTFTLTNAVPQYDTFNNGSWKTMELNVMTTLMENCKNNNQIKAYVVTGAVPSNIKLKNRVNIPDLLWTAYCCYNNNLGQWMAGAHWGENQNEGQTLSKTLAKLNNMLNERYDVSGVKVFPDQCSNGELLFKCRKGYRGGIQVFPDKRRKGYRGGVQVFPDKRRKGYRGGVQVFPDKR
uniref:Uncharacterized protein n=1 Tax=Hucho hucho TaxID=62062 RepID=A0A4W5KLM5_9TELE